MEKNSSKKGDIKISLLGLLIGISLIVAGVYGIVSNKIENQEYKNSTDIRTVNAVVEECRRKDEKNDADILIRSEYNTKVSALRIAQQLGSDRDRGCSFYLRDHIQDRTALFVISQQFIGDSCNPFSHHQFEGFMRKGIELDG